ncbi:MAG: hypothetical protein ACFFAU_01295 [Candidatus Hodarchaeota archaeon]
MIDLCSQIIQALKNESSISSLVDRIKAKKQPETISNKMITVEVIWEPSEPILPAQTANVRIRIYVKDSVSEPYKTLRNISYQVKEFLNRLREDNTVLNVGDFKVYQLLKTGIEDTYEEDSMVWTSLIIFDAVVSENLQD